MKGVLDVFEIPAVSEGVHSCGGVAVVAETTYLAMQARKQLQIDWDFGPAAAESSESLRKQFRRLVDSPMKVVINQGDAEAAISQTAAQQKVECDYELAIPGTRHDGADELHGPPGWRPRRGLGSDTKP